MSGVSPTTTTNNELILPVIYKLYRCGHMLCGVCAPPDTLLLFSLCCRVSIHMFVQSVRYFFFVFSPLCPSLLYVCIHCKWQAKVVWFLCTTFWNRSGCLREHLCACMYACSTTYMYGSHNVTTCSYMLQAQTNPAFNNVNKYREKKKQNALPTTMGNWCVKS